MSDNNTPRATGEAVAWWSELPDSAGTDATTNEQRAKYWEHHGRKVRPLVFGDIPAPRGRVVLLDKWRVVDTNGRDVYGSFASREDAQFYADGTDFRVMRLALVDADAAPPRGRVVTEAELNGMKADADAGWEHVELFRDALAHASKIANEHSAIEEGALTVVRFSTPTWLAFLRSMGKNLALVDADAGEVDRG